MSKKFVSCFTLLAFLGLTVLLINCGSSSSRPAGVLYYLSQGEQQVGSYAINLDSGALSLINHTASTCPTEPCGFPQAIVFDQSGSVAFVLNQGVPTHLDSQGHPDPIPPMVYAYTVKSDGSLTSTGTPVKVGTSIDKDPVTADTATTMTLDPSGTFLLVISQGAPSLPGNCEVGQPPINGCPAISVLGVQSGSGTLTPEGLVSLDFVPTSVTASITGTFNDPNFPFGTVSGTLLHVTGNRDLTDAHKDNAISEFVVQSSGAVTGPLIGSPYTTATNPSSVIAVRTTPVGGAGGLFVYVTNAIDDNVNIYQVCTVADATNCLDSSNDVQNAKMIPVGNPVSVGQEPVAMTIDPTKNFLYVVNQQSSTVSSFRINPTTGALSALNPATVSTGARPVAITMHSNGKFLYVSNNGSSNVSGFNADTTSGALSNAITVTSSAQPAGLVAK